MVTGTEAPWAPWFGAIEVADTLAAAVTVNPLLSVPAPPPGLVTLTSRVPEAALGLVEVRPVLNLNGSEL